MLDRRIIYIFIDVELQISSDHSFSSHKKYDSFTVVDNEEMYGRYDEITIPEVGTTVNRHNKNYVVSGIKMLNILGTEIQVVCIA